MISVTIHSKEYVYFVHIINERILLCAYYIIFTSNQLYRFESNPTKSHSIGTNLLFIQKILLKKKKTVLTRSCGF